MSSVFREGAANLTSITRDLSPSIYLSIFVGYSFDAVKQAYRSS